MQAHPHLEGRSQRKRLARAEIDGAIPCWLPNYRRHTQHLVCRQSTECGCAALGSCCDCITGKGVATWVCGTDGHRHGCCVGAASNRAGELHVRARHVRQLGIGALNRHVYNKLKSGGANHRQHERHNASGELTRSHLPQRSHPRFREVPDGLHTCRQRVVADVGRL